jgi:Fic family protein
MMHSLNSKYLKNIIFKAEHLSSLQKIGEFKGQQALFTMQTPEILDALQQVALVESSESSNRLEGIVASRARVEALVLHPAEPRDRSEQEIAGYRDALNLIHESGSHMTFSVNIIKQIHSWVYRYLPQDGGQWKMSQNDIVDRDSDGSLLRVRFRPVSPVATPGAMDLLVARYQDAIRLNQEPLVIVPLTILDFLCIHPFSDGNGRSARLLTLLLLYHFGYEVGRYISLERIFEESKMSYYETLNASSQGWHEGRHDPFPWLTYFWGVLIRAYGEFEDRVGVITSGKGSKTRRVRDAVNRRLKPFAISDIEHDCPGISREMIRVVLRQLRDEGAIISQGRGRGAKWTRITEFIK